MKVHQHRKFKLILERSPHFETAFGKMSFNVIRREVTAQLDQSDKKKFSLCTR